jgi:hypothetical protein
VNRFLREVRARLGRCKHEPQQFQLELAGPILIRHSDADDEVALRQLAALDSRGLPKGSFLLAEIDGELVAAAPVNVDADLLKDPFRRTANVRELLGLQAGHVRKHRQSAESSRTTDQGELAAECLLDGYVERGNMRRLLASLVSTTPIRQRRFQCANDICFLPSRSPSQ